jgi:hypothetical protein
MKWKVTDIETTLLWAEESVTNGLWIREQWMTEGIGNQLLKNGERMTTILKNKINIIINENNNWKLKNGERMTTLLKNKKNIIKKMNKVYRI